MVNNSRQGVGRYVPRAHPLSWWMLLVTTGAILIISIDRAILPTVLPAILKDFNLSPTSGGFLISLSFVGTAVGAIALGALGDSLGRGPRRAWTWGVAVLVAVVAAVATAFTRTLGLFAFWRVIMGMGTGGMEPVNVAMVGEWWQKEDRGFAVGTHHTGFPFGQFLGPVLIGAVLAAATWREAFLFIPLIAIPIVLIQALIARKNNLKKINDWIREHRMTPSLEESEVRAQQFESPVGKITEAFSHRNVVLSVAMIFLFLWAETGVVSFLTLQLTRDVGLSLASAAVVSGASGITGWIGQIVWGTVSDHAGRKFSLNILAVGWAVTVLAMIFISSGTLAWIILLGWGLFRNAPFPVAYALVLDSVPNSASSGMGLMIGIALGVSGFVVAPVAGYFVAHFGFTWDYVMLAGACLLALVPIAMMRETVSAPDESAPVASQQA